MYTGPVPGSMPACTILHLTDLHYASPNTNFRDDNKAYVPDALRDSYFRRLDDLLTQCFEAEFDAIAVTGDITTHGRPEGFDPFQTTREHLTKLVANPLGVCMVPGNHDVTWGLSTAAPDYFDRKFIAYRNCVVTAKATSSLIPTGTVPTDPYGDLTFASDIPGPLFIDHDRRLAVLCVNSAMRCGEVSDTIRKALSKPLANVSARIEEALKAIGNNEDATTALGLANVYATQLTSAIDKYSLFDIPHVTQTQISQLGRLLFKQSSAMGKEWREYVKVALLHHHLSPFENQLPEYKAFEVLPDASTVIETLSGYGFQTILTGHKHQSYIQHLQSRGTDVLVLGGMTVGGYAVTGYTPSIRHLSFEQSDGLLRVRVADLPCNYDGNIHDRASAIIREAQEQTISVGVPRKRVLVPFPASIELAAEDQLYGRDFYKKDVKFEIDVSDAEDSRDLVFETRMSYAVVNRTATDREWRTEYNYDRAHGVILEANVDDEPYDPEQRDFQVGRGLSIRRMLAPHGVGKTYIHAKEHWPGRGSTFFTSYHPATGLSVIVRSHTPNVEFDFEILYFEDRRTIRNQSHWEMHLEKGLLPYQGVRMNWKRKGVPNGVK